MNIFLSGGKRAGKSTVIERFLKEYRGTVGGFRTVRTKTFLDSFFGVYLTDVQDRQPSVLLEARAGCCNPDGSSICYPNAFEVRGVSLLTQSPMPSLIVMDELGVLEENCSRFQKAVINCLDAQANVLGVIKQKSSPFLDCVRARDDVMILNMDENTRSDAFASIRILLCS